jgi:L-lactate utilization protein LutB
MAKTEKAQSTFGYLERLLEDEYVQDQLRSAIAGLRDTYRRAARQRAEATEDRQLYKNLRRAATSIRNAAIALRQPEPAPKRRGRKLLIITLAAGATAILTKLVQKRQSAALSDLVSSTAPSTANNGGSVQADAVAESFPPAG